MQFGSTSLRKEILYTLILEAVISSLIILISLRVYIFGNGFYDYGDQYWYPTVHRANLISLYPVMEGNYVSILYFTRSLVGGFGVLLSGLSGSPVAQEKIFIVYTFALFIAFSYVVAEIIYRLADTFLTLRLSFLKKELLKSFIVIAIFCNIAIMNLNADGGTWSDSLIMLFIVISVAVPLLVKSKLAAISVVSSLLSISILLDPDYYLVFILVVFFSSLVNYRHSLLQRFIIPIGEIAISVPVILYIIEGMLITSGGFGNPLAGRSIFSIIPAVSQNPITSVLLIRHFWSTYAISPPSILWFIGGNAFLPGFGNIVVLPNSWVTFLWIMALAAYPVLAIGSLIFKRSRKIAVPFVVMWIIGFVLSIWWEIPGIRETAAFASSIRFIGPAIATSLSNPGHYMNVEGIAEVMLLAIFLYNLVSSNAEIYNFIRRGWHVILMFAGVTFLTAAWFSIYNVSTVSLDISSISEYSIIILVFLISLFSYILTRKRVISGLRTIFHAKKSRYFAKKFLVIALVFIFIFTGWQAFNGSFYPERSWTGSTSGVLESPGPFSPWDLPSYVVNEYNALTYSSSYNTVLYYAGYNNFPYDGSFLGFLIGGSYISDILPFLKAENIKYIITYEEPPQTTEVLNESGLVREYLGPSSFLYINNNILGNPYMANLLLNYSSNNYNYLLSYSQFESLNITPVFSETGNNTFGFNNQTDKVNLLTPQYFLSIFPTQNGANMSNALKGNRLITLAPNSVTSTGDGWYVKAGPSPTTLNVSNGTILWNSSTPGHFAIMFGNTTYLGSILSKVTNFKNVSLSGRISFSYNTSSMFNGGVKVSFFYITKNGNSSNLTESFSVPKIIEGPALTGNISYSVKFPNNTEYFTPYILFNASAGSIHVKNLKVIWQSNIIPKPNVVSDSPVPLGNGSIYVKTSGIFYIRVGGTGFLNGAYVNSRNDSWFDISGRFLNFTGNLELLSLLMLKNSTLKELMGNYTVYDFQYNPEARLLKNGSVYAPYYTLTYHEFFITPFSKQGELIFLNISFISYGYLIIALFVTLFPLLTLVILPMLRRRRTLLNGKRKSA